MSNTKGHSANGYNYLIFISSLQEAIGLQWENITFQELPVTLFGSQASEACSEGCLRAQQGQGKPGQCDISSGGVQSEFCCAQWLLPLAPFHCVQLRYNFEKESN